MPALAWKVAGAKPPRRHALAREAQSPDRIAPDALRCPISARSPLAPCSHASCGRSASDLLSGLPRVKVPVVDILLAAGAFSLDCAVSFPYPWGVSPAQRRSLPGLAIAGVSRCRQERTGDMATGSYLENSFELWLKQEGITGYRTGIHLHGGQEVALRLRMAAAAGRRRDRWSDQSRREPPEYVKGVLNPIARNTRRRWQRAGSSTECLARGSPLSAGMSGVEKPCRHCINYLHERRLT